VSSQRSVAKINGQASGFRFKIGRIRFDLAFGLLEAGPHLDRITMDLYSHVMPGMQEDAAARVDRDLEAVINKRTKSIG